MFLIDSLILVTGLLLLLGIASSKFSARLGVPVLVLFLLLGMLAGSEGIGGIDFENYELAHAIGTLALAIILFDGGLQTSLASIRSSWRPSIVLATAGVLLTALLTGVAASWILNISLLEGMLLGSIVGSTDAAAVFAVLRTGGVSLPKRLQSTLEIESASNDPMAVFLTIACIELLLGNVGFGVELFGLFIRQMSLGALVGLAVGYAAVLVVNRINLDAAGLYPVLVSAFSLLTFGIAAWLGGSGFLAVYLAGIVIGNSRLVFQRGILLFHDAGAWLAQIVMFVVLGLLSFPSRLWAISVEGLMVALVLTFVARPVAVLLTLFPFKFNWREIGFLSWVGLKGAVPITLATFPLIYKVPGASLLFDVVFFVVLLSALVQGWTLPWIARILGLELPAEPTPPVTLVLSSLRHVEADIVDFTIATDSHAAGRRIRELALPDGTVIAIVARGDRLIPPRGETKIEAGDHVILVLSAEARPLVNRVFARGAAREELPEALEFPLRATISVGELEDLYGIKMNAPPAATLDEAIRLRSPPDELRVGSVVRYGDIALRVRELNAEGTIVQVGMMILPDTSENSS